MCIKSENPKMKQSETANQLSYSTSVLQRYRNDINMLSAYRIHPNNTNKRAKKRKYTNFDNNSLRNSGPKRPQMTSKDLKKPQSTSNKIGKKVKTENILKGEFIQENVDINDQ